MSEADKDDELEMEDAPSKQKWYKDPDPVQCTSCWRELHHTYFSFPPGSLARMSICQDCFRKWCLDHPNKRPGPAKKGAKNFRDVYDCNSRIAWGTPIPEQYLLKRDVPKVKTSTAYELYAALDEEEQQLLDEATIDCALIDQREAEIARLSQIVLTTPSTQEMAAAAMQIWEKQL